jgi:hypothetical protein
MIVSPGSQVGEEGVQVGNGPRGDPDLGVARPEDLRREFGRDDLDLLDGLQAGLVFVARIAERWPRSQAGAQQGLGARVHDVGRRVEVDALDVVDPAALSGKPLDLALLCARGPTRGGLGERPDPFLGHRGQPRPVGERGRHGRYVLPRSR